jgi:hypothetical protein
MHRATLLQSIESGLANPVTLAGVCLPSNIFTRTYATVLHMHTCHASNRTAHVNDLHKKALCMEAHPHRGLGVRNNERTGLLVESIQQASKRCCCASLH